jgi:LacI family transcriptional regulator
MSSSDNANHHASHQSRRITLKEIATMAGVSVSTASLALSGKGAQQRISPAVEERVREIARQHDYAPNLLVRSLQRGRTQVMGFYSAFRNREPNDIYMDRLTSAIERAAGQLHYDVLIHCDFSRPSADLYQALNGGRFDGLLFFGPDDHESLLPALRTSRLPTVMVNHADPGGKLSSVTDDMLDGMRQVVEALVQRGHRRIAAVAGPPWSDASRRIVALRRGLAAYDVHMADTDIVHIRQDEPEEAEQALRSLLIATHPPTALFCWHDRLGYQLLEACDRLRIAAPEQLSLIGYDGLHWPSTSRHVLASVEVNLDVLARTAVHLLDDLITNVVSAPVMQTYPVTLSCGTTLAPASDAF